MLDLMPNFLQGSAIKQIPMLFCEQEIVVQLPMISKNQSVFDRMLRTYVMDHDSWLRHHVLAIKTPKESYLRIEKVNFEDCLFFPLVQF
jgi:hypothetical protein